MVRFTLNTECNPLPKERITQNNIRNPEAEPNRFRPADHRVSGNAVWAHGKIGDIEDMGVAVDRQRSAAITQGGYEILIKQESIGGG